MESFELGFWDYLTVGVYFTIILTIGVLATRQKSNLDDYFFAGKSMGWFVIGGAIFATNIGTEHLVGLHENGFKDGFSNANIEIMAILPLMLLGWFVAPYFLKNKIKTIPEFIEKRYGALAKWLVIGTSMVAYVITKIGISLYSGAYLLKTLMGWDIYTSSVVMVLLTGIYTMIGGLRAVMYNGAFQAIILLVSGIVVTSLALGEYGGYKTISALAPENFFKIFNTDNSGGDHLIAFTIVAFFNGVWYWCSDQYIVQRTFSAKTVQSARSGTIFAGFLKLALLFVFIFPGIIVRVAHPELDPKLAYSTLIHDVVPLGLRGFILSALLAAMMSSLAAAFNTVSTIFTFDIYRRRYPRAAEFQLLNVGRLATLAIIIVSLVWVPVVPFMTEEVFPYLRVFQSLFGVQIAIIVMLGIFWMKPGKSSAIPTIFVGLFLGIAKLVINEIANGDSGLIGWVASVNQFSYYTFVIATITVVFVLTAMLNKTRNIAPYGLMSFKDSQKSLEYDEPDITIKKRWDWVNLWLTALLIGVLVFLWCWFR